VRNTLRFFFVFKVSCNKHLSPSLNFYLPTHPFVAELLHVSSEKRWRVFFHGRSAARMNRNASLASLPLLIPPSELVQANGVLFCGVKILDFPQSPFTSIFFFAWVRVAFQYEAYDHFYPPWPALGGGSRDPPAFLRFWFLGFLWSNFFPSQGRGDP